MKAEEEDIDADGALLEAHFRADAERAAIERFKLCAALCERSILSLLRPSAGLRIAVGFDYDAQKLLVEPTIVVEVGQNSSGFIATLIASIDARLPASDGRIVVSVTSVIDGRRPGVLSPLTEAFWEHLKTALAVARRKGAGVHERRGEREPRRGRAEVRKPRLVSDGYTLESTLGRMPHLKIGRR